MFQRDVPYIISMGWITCLMALEEINLGAVVSATNLVSSINEREGH